MVIFSTEILVILVMLLVVVKVFKMTDPEAEGGSAGPNIFEPVRENPEDGSSLPPQENFVVNDAVKEDPIMKNYWNILAELELTFQFSHSRVKPSL